MGKDAERFRTRARECRDLSRNARPDEVRRQLLQLADELDVEAELIDAEEEAARDLKN
jgi:hypothetical protein